MDMAARSVLYSDNTTQADALIAVARDFGARGWTPATSGNYSARLDDERMLITRSGSDKRHLTSDDLIVVRADGTDHAASELGASAETLLHAQLYGRDPMTRAVVHAHSPAATVASRVIAGGGRIRLTNYELLKAFDGINSHEATLDVPVLPNRQDMRELAALAAERLDRRPGALVYLVEGHGAYAWGPDVVSAYHHFEALEFLLNCHLEERRLIA